MAEHRIEMMRLSEIQGAIRNPKQHDTKRIEESLERFGFISPVTIDEKTGRLVAGHGRLEALKHRKAMNLPPPGRIEVAPDGEWLVPVLRGIVFEDARQAEAYLLADNRLVEAGGWDEGELLAMLSDIQKDTTSLEGIGWDAHDLDALSAFAALNEHEAGAADASAELPVGWQPPEVRARVIITCPDWEAVRRIVAKLGAEFKDKQVTYDYADLKLGESES
jgi:hypothetical protein